MQLLHIDSSVLGENSVSRKLSAAIVAKQKALHPGLEVVALDLTQHAPMHLTPVHIGAMFGHPPTDEAILADLAVPYIEQILAADIIVIGTPMYNFTIPSHLKAWIDRITIAGKTFKYSATGTPVGLVPPGKKVFIASSRGGVYSEGSPMGAFDHQERLLRDNLGYIGLHDVTVIRAEGVAIPDLKPGAIAAAAAQIEALTA